jgi:hypothetical protein
LFVLTVVAAAPPPKEETEEVKFRRVWGETVDADKDCEFKQEGDRLKIKIPKMPHPFSPGRPPDSSKAPRVRREVNGDFDARIKIISVTPPGENAGGGLMTSGGLYLGTDDYTFVVVSRYTNRNRQGADVDHSYLVAQRTPGVANTEFKDYPAEARGKPVFVRLKREGKTVTVYTSMDGETWAAHATRPHAWPDKVYVGVFASHVVNHAVEGVFEDFKVIQPGK